jgi:hypothetical protein
MHWAGAAAQRSTRPYVRARTRWGYTPHARAAKPALADSLCAHLPSCPLQPVSISLYAPLGSAEDGSPSPPAVPRSRCTTSGGSGAGYAGADDPTSFPARAAPPLSTTSYALSVPLRHHIAGCVAVLSLLAVVGGGLSYGGGAFYQTPLDVLVRSAKRHQT